MATTIVNNFEIPSWAGKPPPGLHLDVLKDGKMIQKLMIDEKKCYFFGRNKQLCDFCIDHASSSRVHAALVWHKFLERPFIVDLGSTHGTFIGQLRLEPKKPQQVPIDSLMHFGASTRTYIIRERPHSKINSMNDYAEDGEINALPETELELDNLTEFNTAHNRRIATVADLPDASNSRRRKRASSTGTHVVHFNEEEVIINPEDIDPSVGRFRNLIQTTVIPKRAKIDLSGLSSIAKPNQTTSSNSRRLSGGGSAHYDHTDEVTSTNSLVSIAEKFGLRAPNSAPDLSEPSNQPITSNVNKHHAPADDASNEPKKKKYVKESWPGKKPTHGHAYLI
ncbi:hypothetical protein HELRODRAFT_100131 [Helobdella robusta]|uniref:Nuclear inhibitor of protein phosphatase 1 n=1 Tax=Helobdella robusta TaxID=6412 RepID=T1ECY8_HELRO|nr:hypothetical protein HELRODRAFT_100131 [Helobdella robusta]ESO03369.1 hypothetical protein HELRODRAFT_100131 [Helobdella robusta]